MACCCKSFCSSSIIILVLEHSTDKVVSRPASAFARSRSSWPWWYTSVQVLSGPSDCHTEDWERKTCQKHAVYWCMVKIWELPAPPQNIIDHFFPTSWATFDGIKGLAIQSATRSFPQLALPAANRQEFHFNKSFKKQQTKSEVLWIVFVLTLYDPAVPVLFCVWPLELIIVDFNIRHQHTPPALLYPGGAAVPPSTAPWVRDPHPPPAQLAQQTWRCFPDLFSCPKRTKTNI